MKLSKYWLTIALWSFFGVFSWLVGVGQAHAEQVTGSPFPTFTQDGSVFGSAQNGVYGYYGGIAFDVEQTFQAGGVKMRACSNATTSLPVQVFFEVYDITGISTSTGEYSNHTQITTWAGTVDSCAFGIADVFVNHNYDFDPTIYTFTVGKKYMIVPQDFGNLNDTVWGYIEYTSTFAPADNISTCRVDLFCGGFFFKASHESVWVSFADTGIPAPVDTCFLTSFPFFDLFQCVSDTLSYLFVPSSTTFDNFETLKDDIKNKAPFGYLTSAVNTISDITGTTTPTFQLATSTPIMSYIFTPLRTGLSWLLYFSALLWLYKRLTHITI